MGYTDNSDARLDSLLDSFQVAIKTYRDELKSNGLPPLGYTGYRPYDDTNYVLPPKLYEAKKIVLATLGMIGDSIQSPFDKVAETILCPTQTAAVQLMVRAGIPDLIARHTHTSSPASIHAVGNGTASANGAAHPHSHEQKSGDEGQGLSIPEIAQKINLPAPKFAAAMQLLASTGWFVEDGEGRYMNTRFSEELRKGRYGADWAGASEFWVRSWAYEAEAATKPEWRQSLSPVHSGTQLAHRSEKHFFEILNESGESVEGFVRAINALDNSVLGGIVQDFPWKDVPDGITMVDVGGGAGSLSLAIGRQNPHLSFLIQDQPGPCAQAQLNFMNAVWVDPSLVGVGGRFRTQVQDFFESQPGDVGGDGVWYMLKWIMHDWPEEECVKILSHLAVKMGPNSRLIIFEHIVQSNATDSSSPSVSKALSEVSSISKAGERYEPIGDVAFVPGSFGRASNLPLFLSYSMTCLFNGSERPVEFYKHIFDRAGLEFVKVHPLRTWVWGVEGRKKSG